MTDTQNGNLLWWVIPGVLAGMPMPFIHHERRLNHGGPLDAYEGIGSILRHLRGKEKQEFESDITLIAPAAP